MKLLQLEDSDDAVIVEKEKNNNFGDGDYCAKVNYEENEYIWVDLSFVAVDMYFDIYGATEQKQHTTWVNFHESTKHLSFGS